MLVCGVGFVVVKKKVCCPRFFRERVLNYCSFWNFFSTLNICFILVLIFVGFPLKFLIGVEPGFGSVSLVLFLSFIVFSWLFSSGVKGLVSGDFKTGGGLHG